MPIDMSDEEFDRKYSLRPTTRFSPSIISSGIFSKMLIKYFKRYRNLSSPGDEVKVIRRSLEHFSEYLCRDELTYEYIEVIFNFIEFHRITNSDIIRNTLQDYIMHVLKQCKMVRIKLRRPALTTHFRKTNIHYVALQGGLKKKISLDSIFFLPPFLRDLGFVKKLLRYGVRFRTESEDVRRYQRLMMTYLLDQCGMGIFPDEVEEEVQYLVDARYPECGDCKRLYFVFLAMYAVIEKYIYKSVLHDNFIKSLKLIFDSIRDPLITVTEIARFFKIVLKIDSEEERISEFCNFFKEILPSSAEPPQPRSLQHLCRCQVRECLTLSMKLPHGTWKLNIPKSLKNYILLQKTAHEYDMQNPLNVGLRKQHACSSRSSERLKKYRKH